MVFIPSNEPFQRGVEGLENALAARQQREQMGLKTQQMQQSMQKRQELDMILQTSENPERDAYEWSKRNDQDLFGKLATLHTDKLKQELPLNPQEALNRFKMATGEEFKYDPSSGVMEIPIGEEGKPPEGFMLISPKGQEYIKAEKPLATRAAEAQTMAAAETRGRVSETPLKPQTDMNTSAVELFQKDPDAYKRMRQIDEGVKPPSSPYGQRTIVTLYGEDGKANTYWADPVNQKLTPVEEGKGLGRTEPRDIPQGSQAVIQSADVALPVVDELEKDLWALDSGPLKGRWAQFSLNSLGGAGLGKKEVAIRTKMGRLSADQLFGEGGKALTTTEKELISPYVIGQTDTLGTAVAKLPELKKRLKTIRNARFNMLSPRTKAVHQDISQPGSSGQSAEQNRRVGDPGWNDSKEARYQELLRKRGGK